MVHCIIQRTSMRVFVDGICAQGHTFTIPAHDIDPGHYEAEGGAIVDDAECLALKALSDFDVSDLIRHGRTFGARCRRWRGNTIALAGVVLPAAHGKRTLNLGRVELGAAACGMRIFVSVLSP